MTINLKEIFNTVKDFHFINKGNHELGFFSVDGKDYQVQIDSTGSSIQHEFEIPELENKKVAEISFLNAKEEDLQTAYSTQSNTDNTLGSSASIYGIVANRLAEKFKNDYDAFFYTLESQHSSSSEEYDKKSRIYRMIAATIRGKVGRHSANYYELKRPNIIVYLVSKIPLSRESEHSSGLINPIKESMREYGSLV